MCISNMVVFYYLHDILPLLSLSALSPMGQASKTLSVIYQSLFHCYCGCRIVSVSVLFSLTAKCWPARPLLTKQHDSYVFDSMIVYCKLVILNTC